MTWENILPLVQTVVGTVITLAFWFVIAYLKSRTAAIQDEQVRRYAIASVEAVEQLFSNLESMEKYRAAETRMRSFLASNGIKLTDEQIRTYIEAAVLKLQFNEGEE